MAIRHGKIRGRSAATALVLVSTLLVSCSSSPSGEQANSRPAGADADAVFLPASAEVQMLRSGEDPSHFAVDCVGTPSLRFAEGVTLASPADGVTVEGDVLSFPAGAGGYRLDVAVNGTSSEVKVRCLPEGFPRVRVEGTFSDWLVLTAQNIEPDVRPYQMLVDSSGFPVWFRETLPISLADMEVVGDRLLSFTRGPRPLYAFSNAPGFGFVLEDFSGTAVTSWVPADGEGLDHHEAVLMPNGNLLAIVYEETSVPPRPGMGVLSGEDQGNRPPCPEKAPSSTDRTIHGRIVEIRPDGSKVNEWRLEEHLPDAASSPGWVNLDTAGLNCVVDVDHLNTAMFYGDAPGSSTGKVLVTGRHIDGAVMLSWPEGEVLWTLGGRPGPASLAILDDPFAGVSRPHDANVIGDDLILIYDNRANDEPSRAAVYRIDTAAGTATLVESYSARCGTRPCSAYAMGSSRPTLDASGIVIGWGTESVAASEFPRGSDTTSAQLVLEDTWTYRVLPTAPLDRDELFAAQNRLPRP